MSIDILHPKIPLPKNEVDEENIFFFFFLYESAEKQPKKVNICPEMLINFEEVEMEHKS